MKNLNRIWEGLRLVSALFLFIPESSGTIAVNPFPANNSTNQNVNPKLSWSAPGKNLLRNSGFELGTLEGWKLETLGGLTFAITPYSSPLSLAAHQGAFSIVTPIQTPRGIVALSQRVKIPREGKVYLSWAQYLAGATLFPWGEAGGEFMVQLRRPNGVIEEILYSTREFTTMAWRWMNVEIAGFKGEEVEIAFIFDNGPASSNQRARTGLDEIRLEAWSEEDGYFEVYLGKSDPLQPSDLIQETAGVSWPVERLERNIKYYWQVVHVSGGQRNPSEVWNFRTGPTGRIRFADILYTPPTSPQIVGAPAEITLRSVDELGTEGTGAKGTNTLFAEMPGVRNSSVVISEIDAGTTNAVELVNVSGEPVPIGKWRLEMISATGNPGYIYTFPENLIAQPGDVVIVRARTSQPNYPNMGPSISSFGWHPGGLTMAALLYDSETNFVDVVFSGMGQPRSVRGAKPLTIEQWKLPTATLPFGTNLTLQRVGDLDRNSVVDWKLLTRSTGKLNEGMAAVFQPAAGKLPIDPEMLTLPGTPVFRTNTHFLRAAKDVKLNAEVRVSNFEVAFWTFDSKLDVLEFPEIELEAAGLPREGMDEGGIEVQLPQARTTNLTVWLAMEPVGELEMPQGQVITIPAGERTFFVPVKAIDDTELDGIQLVRISGQAEGFSVLGIDLEVHDNETATITLQVPTEIEEGRSVTGRVDLDRAVAKEAWANLGNSRNSLVEVPPRVLIPAGARQVEFQINAVENPTITGIQSVEVWAEAGGWTGSRQTIAILDNDAGGALLKVPAILSEGTAVQTNKAQIILPGILAQEQVFTVQTSDNTELIVPGTISIAAGESGGIFNIAAAEDVELDGWQDVLLTLTAPGFEKVTAQVRVLDNDPAGFEIERVPSPQIAGQSFPVRARAFDSKGALLGGLSPTANLKAYAEGEEADVSGSLSVGFTNGFWEGIVTIPEAAKDVRLRIELGTAAEGTPFNVLALPDRVVSLKALDIVADEARNRLLVSVGPDDPAEANEVLALDPNTGAIISRMDGGTFEYSHPMAPLIREGRMHVKGNTLYLATSGGASVRTYNLTTDTFNSSAVINTTSTPGWVGDIMSVPDRPGRVLVGQTDGSSSLGTRLLFSATGLSREYGASLLVDGADSGVVYGLVENSPFPWTRYDVTEAGGITVTPLGVGSYAAGDMKRVGREIILATGQVINIDNFQVVDSYPVAGAVNGDWWDGSSGRLVADEATQRIFFISLEWAAGTTQLLQAFDLKTRQLIGVTRVPTGGKNAGRLAKVGNILAFHNSEEVHLLRSPLWLPNEAAVSVRVSQEVIPAPPTAGEVFKVKLTVVNQSDEIADDVWVKSELPAGHIFSEAKATRGDWEYKDGKMHWHLPHLPFGVVENIELTLQTSVGGPFTNRVQLVANEWNTALPNTWTNFVSDVRIRTDVEGYSMLDFDVRELVWDKQANLLYLARQEGSLVGIKPDSGEIVFELPLNGVPSRLSLTRDHLFLYILMEGARVHRLNLQTRTIDLSFDIPGLAVDIQALGTTGEALAASWYAEGGYLTIGLLDSGIVNTNGSGTSAYMPPLLEPTEDPNMFYAWNSTFVGRSTVRQFRVANGNLEAGPVFVLMYGGTGPDFRYAEGKVYLASGEVVDPVTGELLGHLAGGDAESFVAPDSINRKVFLYDAAGIEGRLQSHDMSTGELLGTMVVPNQSGLPRSMTRWGTDGLAVALSNGRVLLFRSGELAEPEIHLEVQKGKVTFVTRTGRNYQLERSATFPAVWEKVGSEIGGKDIVHEMEIPMGEATEFFRVSSAPIALPR